MTDVSEINQPIEMMTGKKCIIHHLISLNFPPSCQVLTSSWCVLTDDGLSVGFCCQQPNGKHLGGRGDQLSLPPLPEKINMSPEKGPFQKEVSSSNHGFSGSILVFGGVHASGADFLRVIEFFYNDILPYGNPV